MRTPHRAVACNSTDLLPGDWRAKLDQLVDHRLCAPDPIGAQQFELGGKRRIRGVEQVTEQMQADVAEDARDLDSGHDDELTVRRPDQLPRSAAAASG